MHFREEIAEAQRTNKPSGRCCYCLMISKTCKEASKNIQSRGGAPKEEYMFVNAEEEFFYEVCAVTVPYSNLCRSGGLNMSD